MDTESSNAIKIYHTLKNFLIPYDTNFKKVRIGSNLDGGYVIAEMKNFDTLYSYGCDNKLSFETDFYEKYGSQCYLYDHTLNMTENIPKYIKFKKEGVSHVKCDNMNTLDSHIIENGHENSQNLFLQMDIEGAEYKTLLASNCLTNFSQIVLEFHIRVWENNFKVDTKDLKELLEKLNQSFRCIHIHGNNSYVQPWYYKNKIPLVFEVTYVRKDLISSYTKRTIPFPEEGLDFPNFPHAPDLTINYFIDDY